MIKATKKNNSIIKKISEKKTLVAGLGTALLFQLGFAFDFDVLKGKILDFLFNAIQFVGVVALIGGLIWFAVTFFAEESHPGARMKSIGVVVSAIFCLCIQALLSSWGVI